MSGTNLTGVSLESLGRLYAVPGPFLTVCVPSESAVEQAAERYELAWKNVRNELCTLGLPERVIEVALGARGEHWEGASRLVVVSLTDPDVVVGVSLASEPRQTIIDVAPLPHLMPLVEELVGRVPHLVVHADHKGADVEAFADADELVDEITVKGSTLHLKKVQVGGWAHHRYQHRSENQWKSNADVCMKVVVELAERIGAELIIGVGEERQLVILADMVPAHLKDAWREIPGGRGQDGSEQLIPGRVRDLVATFAAEKVLGLLEEYAQERGQAKRACDGLEETLAALQKAQVATLILTTDPSVDPLGGADKGAGSSSLDAVGEGTGADMGADMMAGGDISTSEASAAEVAAAVAKDAITPALAPTLYYGPDPLQVAATRTELLSMGVEEDQISEAPLVDVLLRTVIGGSASVVVVPHQMEAAPQGGIGALLRYADGPANVYGRGESAQGNANASGGGSLTETGDASPYPTDSSRSSVAGPVASGTGQAGGDPASTGSSTG